MLSEVNLFLTFWLGGIVDPSVAIAGLIANLVGVLILCKDNMRNSFNFLLIARICMESSFLVCRIIEADRTVHRLLHGVARHFHQYFLLPASISMTASIFMMVGIAQERYIAVHNPINHRQAIDSPGACRRRLVKYVVPVVILAVTVNLPRFFEYNEDASLTALGRNPNYIIYYKGWTTLILIEILPVLLLIYFNYKVYRVVKHRNQRLMTIANYAATQLSVRRKREEDLRRKREDHLAMVFMGIMLMFCVCHAPRIFLSFYDGIYIHR